MAQGAPATVTNATIFHPPVLKVDVAFQALG